MQFLTHVSSGHRPWNKGRLTGQKPPLKLKEIGAIRIRLQREGRIRDLALFNLAIDSKLRACDLVGLRVGDVMHGQNIVKRAMVLQRKTQQPVQIEIMQQREGRPQASCGSLISSIELILNSGARAVSPYGASTARQRIFHRSDTIEHRPTQSVFKIVRHLCEMECFDDYPGFKRAGV